MADTANKTVSRMKLPDGEVYDIDALTTNGHSVNADVPSDAKFTDTQRSKTDIVDMIYPVGSIYMSVNSTDPGTLFGGSWTQLKDRFLLSAGDTYKAGSTGGEASHTLTVDEMPKHYHHVPYGDPQATSNDGAYEKGTSYNGNAHLSSSNEFIGSPKYPSDSYYNQISISGKKGTSTQSFNIMPPYLTVYMWKRTA